MSVTSPDPALEQNKRLLLRYLDDAWNKSRRQALTESFARNCILHAGSREAHGPADFFHIYDLFQAQFARISFQPIVVLAEADLVCAHWRIEAVYRATHTSVQITGTSIVRVHDGRFIEAWQNWDAASLAAQLPGFVLP